MQFLLSLALWLVAQPLFAQSKATIEGKIQKSLSDEVTLATYPSPLLPEESQTVVKLHNGQFRLELPITQAGIVELVHGRESVPLYLEPGYDLKMSISGQKFLTSVSFEGKGANENNFLSQYTLYFDEEEDYQPLPDNIKLRESEFIQFLEERREDQLTFLKKYSAKKPLSENFRKLMLAEIAYSYANDRLTFFSLRERVVINDGNLTPSASYFNFLKTLDLQQPQNLQSNSFTTFLRNYVTYLAGQANVRSTDKHYFKKSYELVSSQLAGDARIMAQAYIIRQSLQQGNVLHASAMLQDFDSTSGQPAVHASLRQVFEGMSGLGIGSPAPDFELKDVAGNVVSLSGFRGKVVYLGFWRTNCGLCMIEQPHTQELARKLQGQEVVFVNIGVDEDEQVWRRAVESGGRYGVQLYLKGQGAELARQYGLKDVPAYFLIDETGTIISTKPRRPNDREAEKEILQHVISGRALHK
ncbi:thiol-disulfide isomerase [Pontibacter sp. HJ8]